ncbi:MAG: DDE-type integrase/transposase/recombinase [Methanobacterium sp.]|jgi:transposase InsO family protein
MDETTKQKIALFKYSLIAPLLINSYVQPTAKAYIESICGKVYETPYYGSREFSPSTIKDWLTDYRKHGIEGLYPAKRSDCGTSRLLNEVAKRYIIESKTENPSKPVRVIFHEMVVKGIVAPDSISMSTIQRFVSNHKLNRKSVEHKDRRAFSMEFPGDCWQSDVSTGPYLTINGFKKKTYIIAIIDDNSRAIMACSAFYEQNLISLLSVFKQAVQRRGIPKKLFVDNGQIYRSDQLQFICASLGTVLSHAEIYQAQSKGKIERWFHTFQSQFLNLLDWTKLNSLEELNQKLNSYIEDQYHQTIHSTIKTKPIDKYLEHLDKIRFVSSKQELDHIFLYRTTRKIKNDATLPILNVHFEVPAKYIGERINVRYDPTCLDKAYIFNDNGKCLEAIHPVDRVANSKVLRNSKVLPIDFSEFSQ